MLLLILDLTSMQINQIVQKSFILYSVVNTIFRIDFLRLDFFDSFLGNAKKNGHS